MRSAVPTCRWVVWCRISEGPLVDRSLRHTGIAEVAVQLRRRRHIVENWSRSRLLLHVFVAGPEEHLFAIAVEMRERKQDRSAYIAPDIIEVLISVRAPLRLDVSVH